MVCLRRVTLYTLVLLAGSFCYLCYCKITPWNWSLVVLKGMAPVFLNNSHFCYSRASLDLRVVTTQPIAPVLVVFVRSLLLQDQSLFPVHLFPK